MHVAVRHEFVHQPGECVSGPELNNLGSAGGAARLHAGTPIHRLLDLASQLVRARLHVEYGGSIYPAQQPDIDRHLSRQVGSGQRLPELIASIRQ
jgi:hypothetical protein